VLLLQDHWIWDSWYVDDGARFHAFFLKAPRSLGDPELRHHHASIGHAVSDDLVLWTELPDALRASEAVAADDMATWTGSVVLGPDGVWHLFYTGISQAASDNWQRVLHATSFDLVAWRRVAAGMPVQADPRWYQTYAETGREDWRDPWVFFDAPSGQWHMLMSANAKDGAVDQRGTVGHATSSDMYMWTVQPPLAMSTGFRQLEVTQTEIVDGHAVIVWCMLAGDTHVPGMHSLTGTWTAPADSLLGPFHFDRAEPIEVHGTYAGRIVRDRAGTWNLLAFVDVDSHGKFGGYIGDPIPLALTDRGTLQPRT
jgi:beta-fructofuranosidase